MCHALFFITNFPADKNMAVTNVAYLDPTHVTLSSAPEKKKTLHSI